MGSLAETDARFRFLAASYPYGTPARVAERPARFRVHEQSLTFGAPTVSRSEEAAAFLTNATECQWNSVRAIHGLTSSPLACICAPDACGRLGATFKRLYDAATASKPRFWRLVAGGAFGQLRSRLLKTTRIGPLHRPTAELDPHEVADPLDAWDSLVNGYASSARAPAILGITTKRPLQI
jgi:hypothetical protein